MAWSGGTFTRTDGTYSGASVWASNLGAAIKIVAARHDIHDQDLATGINACLNKNGQNSPTANINWGNFKITNLGTANANGQAVEYSQLAGKQDASTILNSIDGAGIVADQGFYGTSADNVDVYTLTAAARTFSAAASAAAQVALLPIPFDVSVAISDETTAITIGTAKVTWRATRAFTITAAKASLTTASSSGLPTFDINKNGVSIFSTVITIDVSETTSLTAATPPVLTTTAVAADDVLTFDIDVAGTGAKGAKITLVGKTP